MNFKYTSDTLKKTERILKDLGYLVRFERGNFHAGYCILEKKKVVVINKFYDTESRINSLVEILNYLKFGPDQLSEESLTWGRKAFGDDFASNLPESTPLETDAAEAGTEDPEMAREEARETALQ